MKILKKLRPLCTSFEASHCAVYPKVSSVYKTFDYFRQAILSNTDKLTNSQYL